MAVPPFSQDHQQLWALAESLSYMRVRTGSQAPLLLQHTVAQSVIFLTVAGSQ